MVRTKTMIVLGLLLFLISTSALADQPTADKPEDWEKRLEMLRSVPYLALSEAEVDESDTGVVFYNPELAHQGYNFYGTRTSGEAFVIDMEGRVVHRWSYTPKRGAGSDHAHMLENGDLIIIKKFEELLRINWDSDVIWRRSLPPHHDVAQGPDGSLYVIIREVRPHRGLNVRFAAMVRLTEDGDLIEKWSTYTHLAEIKNVLDTRSFMDAVLDSALAGRSQEEKETIQAKIEITRDLCNFDYFHLNSVNFLPATISGQKDARFREGNLLVCFRNVNQIAVLEQDTYRVLWGWGEGELQWPHHPTMLDNGHILIFDNGIKRDYSRVVEMDPLTGTIVWEYVADPPEEFFSYARGSAQRLPNGNTLICESDKGRAFEITHDGEVVWVWLNPATEQGHRVTVYRMIRMPTDQVEALLNRRWWWSRLVSKLKRLW